MLINEIQRYNAINKKVFCISSSKDTRSGVNEIRTHSGHVIRALKIETLDNIFIEDNIDVIGIDECQFFENLKKFVTKYLNKGKIIILAGLDGDYKQKKFGSIIDFIPLADEYTKLYALCSICKDGTRASFTKRINTDNKSQELVGADNYYVSVCRKHLISS